MSNTQNNYKIFLSKPEVTKLKELTLTYQNLFPKQKDALSTLVREIILKTAIALRDLKYIISVDIDNMLDTPMFNELNNQLKTNNMNDDFNSFFKQLLQIYEIRKTIDHHTITEESIAFRSTKETKEELESIITMNLKISNNHIFTDLVKYFIHLSPFKQHDIMFFNIRRHLFNILQTNKKETIILNINNQKIKPFCILNPESQNDYFSLIGINIYTNKIVTIPLNEITYLSECERTNYFDKEELYNLSLYFDYSSKLGEFIFKIVDDNFNKNSFFELHPNYTINNNDTYSLWIRPIEFFNIEDTIKSKLEIIKYPKRYEKFKNLL